MELLTKQTQFEVKPSWMDLSLWPHPQRLLVCRTNTMLCLFNVGVDTESGEGHLGVKHQTPLRVSAADMSAKAHERSVKSVLSNSI